MRSIADVFEGFHVFDVSFYVYVKVFSVMYFVYRLLCTLGAVAYLTCICTNNGLCVESWCTDQFGGWADGGSRCRTGAGE